MPFSPPAASRRDTPARATPPGGPDPYSWLREPTDPETGTYLADERRYYDARVAPLAGLKETLQAEMESRTSPVDRSVSWRKGDHEYFTLIPMGADLPRLCRRSADPATAQGDEEVLVDLSVVAGDAGSTYAELGVAEVSPDGRWLAWSVDLDGDETYLLRFRDLTTGVDRAEECPRTYYGGAWSADSAEFFYTVPDDAYRPYQVRRHRLGSDPPGDPLVWQEDDARFEATVEASRSGDWVVVTLLSRDTTEVLLIPAAEPAATPRVVEPRRPGVEYWVEHAPFEAPGGRRDELLILTNDTAEEYRLVRAPTAAPGRRSWDEVVAADPQVRLSSVDAFATHLVLGLRTDGAPLLRVVRRDGSAAFDLLPDEQGGTVGLGRNEEFTAAFVTVSTESYTTPTTWWDVDLDTGRRTQRDRREVPGYRADDYVGERRWVVARDGARIPVTVVRRRDTPLDGSAPCLLYGYGAYEYCFEPEFDRTLASLLDRGAVFAHAHVRGGGEMGRRWWLDGRLLAKKNTFTDFADVADALAAGGSLGLVDGTRMGCRGLSAGGLLMGVSYSTRPDRWRAVVAEVPFVDVVNSMLDQSIPLTVAEWDEWGDPRIPALGAYLASYSPYEILPAATGRPALLVTGAVHDPRVLVHEPAKWVAALRASDPGAGAGVDPSDPVSRGTVLFRCETGDGGHHGPAGRYAALGYEAEVQAWLLTAFGLG